MKPKKAISLIASLITMNVMAALSIEQLTQSFMLIIFFSLHIVGLAPKLGSTSYQLTPSMNSHKEVMQFLKKLIAKIEEVSHKH